MIGEVAVAVPVRDAQVAFRVEHQPAFICDLCRRGLAIYRAKGGGDVCRECAVDIPTNMLITNPSQIELERRRIETL